MAPSPGGSPPSGVASEPGGDLDDDTLVRAELSGLDMHLSAGQPEPGRSRLQDGVVSQGAEGLLDRSDGLGQGHRADEGGQVQDRGHAVVVSNHRLRRVVRNRSRASRAGPGLRRPTPIRNRSAGTSASWEA